MSHDWMAGDITCRYQADNYSSENKENTSRHARRRTWLKFARSLDSNGGVSGGCDASPFGDPHFHRIV
jgi:hypothetical protein